MLPVTESEATSSYKHASCSMDKLPPFQGLVLVHFVTNGREAKGKRHCGDPDTQASTGHGGSSAKGHAERMNTQTRAVQKPGEAGHTPGSHQRFCSLHRVLPHFRRTKAMRCLNSTPHPSPSQHWSLRPSGANFLPVIFSSATLQRLLSFPRK